MFTGIITGLGQITEVRRLGEAAEHGVALRVRAPEGFLRDVALGDSIAIQGACMTVIAFDVAASTFDVEVSAESLAHTVGLDRVAAVNLELALRAHDRLGGHIVTGHVDDKGEVTAFEPVGESWLLRIRTTPDLAAFVARKGSITVNGVSLTVNRVRDDADGRAELDINLIPHTLGHTTLGNLAVGSPVNLEVDLIARYVERMLACGAGAKA